jgi:two-component system OmpR family sensor kinase
LRRLAIRWRLTLAFAGALALVITALVLFIFARVSTELDRAIDGGLRDRASTLSTLAQERDPRRAGQRLRADLAANGEGFAQVLTFDGSVVLDATPSHRRLLDRREIAQAIARPLLIDRPPAAGGGAGVRLYAVPVDVSGRRYVAVVGTSLRDRERAVQGLTTVLVVSGPIAVVLLSLVAYAVLSGALRPVEHMREQAARISAQHTGARLPVPTGDDELARLGRTLNEMLERLEHALIRERDFSANASHELRTPLAMLMTEVELALERPRTLDEMRVALISVGEEAERLVRLAEDLLALSRADRGQLPIHPTRTDVADLLLDLRDRFAQRVHQHGRIIEVDAPEPVMINADRLRLEQAVGNLVENSLRHGQGTIELSLQLTADTVELQVRDHGPGFTDAFIPDAFERFTRGDEARTRVGSGLGLAIVRAIAEAHAGRAQPRNRPDGGAEVSISLPLANIPADRSGIHR